METHTWFWRYLPKLESFPRDLTSAERLLFGESSPNQDAVVAAIDVVDLERALRPGNRPRSISPQRDKAGCRRCGHVTSWPSWARSVHAQRARIRRDAPAARVEPSAGYRTGAEPVCTSYPPARSFPAFSLACDAFHRAMKARKDLSISPQIRFARPCSAMNAL